MTKSPIRLADPERPIAVRVRYARNKLGMAQGELADLVGVKQQAIGEIERGVVHRPSRLLELAKALHRTQEWLMGAGDLEEEMPHEPNASDAREVVMPRTTLPLLGQAVGGSDGRFLMNGRKLADVGNIPSLVGVVGAYAVYVYGDSMLERFKHGETAFVHPHMPYNSGDDVVVQIKPDKRGDAPMGYIKRFKAWRGDKLILEQLNPRKELEFSRSSVMSVHKIVLAGEA